MEKIHSEIFEKLPRAYQIFYKICKEAGLESNITEKDENNDNVKSQIFNKKSKHVQKTFILDDEKK